MSFNGIGKLRFLMSEPYRPIARFDIPPSTEELIRQADEILAKDFDRRLALSERENEKLENHR